MRKIAFLNRSIFMMEQVSREFKKRGYSTYLINHNRIHVDKKCFDEIVYLPARAAYSDEYNISDENLLNSGILQFEYWRKIKNRSIHPKQIKIIKKHMTAIRNYVVEQGIDTVILYNGSTIMERITDIVFKDLGLRTIYIEEGFYRPFTISIDSRGVNANNSVPRDRDFYKKIEVDETLYENNLRKPLTVNLVNRKFENLFIKILKKITYGSINKINEYRGLQIKTDYMVTPRYILMKLIQPVSSKSRFYRHVSLPEKFIFVPLQVHSDSQILLYSKQINTMDEFIELVSEAVKKLNVIYNENYSIVIKQHPQDYLQYSKYNANDENCSIMVIDHYDTDELIKKSAMVITINSTVAIEALIHGKKVITLGDAFFNIDGIVHYCHKKSELPELIYRVLRSPTNHSLTRKFLYYLRFKYNIEGFLNTKDKQTCINIVDRIIQLTNKHNNYEERRMVLHEKDG